MTITVDDLVERTFREWLESPDDQQHYATLDGALTDAATSLTFTIDDTFNREPYIFSPGSIVEIDYEAIGVGSVTDTQLTQLRRGLKGTVAKAHDDNSLIKVAPTYLRQSVYEAISSSIKALFPRLNRIASISVTLEEPFTPIPADAKNAIQFFTVSGSSIDYYPCRILDVPIVSSTGKGLVVNGLTSGQGIFTYTAPYCTPSSPFDRLVEDLGVTPDLHEAIMVWAVISLIGTKDLDTVSSEYLSRQLEARNFPVNSTTSLRNGLIRYYEYLMSNLITTRPNILEYNGWVVGA